METLEEKPDIKPPIPFLAELIALGNLSKKYKEKLCTEGCSSQPCGDKTGFGTVKQPTPNRDIQINDVLYNNSWSCPTNSLDNDQEVKYGNQLKTLRESEGTGGIERGGKILQEAGGNGIRESVKIEVCQITVKYSNITFNERELSLRSAACSQLPEKGVSVSKNECKKPHKCNVCGKGFSQPGLWLGHERTHMGERPFMSIEKAGKTLQEAGGHGISDSDAVCQVTVEDSNITFNERELSLRSSACSQLPEKGVSVSKNVVTSDVRSNGSRNHYHCNVSGEEFNQTRTLIIHKKSHINEKPNKCDVCGKEFKRNCDLKVHKMTHAVEKPYKCDMCGTRWHTKYKLQRHLSAHTGEKPYKCDVCGTGCFTKSNLRSHMKTHTGEKPYKCDVCGKGFLRYRDLEVHKLTHTRDKPYKCDVCDSRWYTKYKLQRHMKTHKGDKPYKCDVCGTRWYTKYKLQRYLLAHTGEKPYKCDVCSTGCSTKVIYKAI